MAGPELEVARVQAERSEAGFVLVLDEIQKVPDWSETVKGLWMPTAPGNAPFTWSSWGRPLCSCNPV